MPSEFQKLVFSLGFIRSSFNAFSLFLPAEKESNTRSIMEKLGDDCSWEGVHVIEPL